MIQQKAIGFGTTRDAGVFYYAEAMLIGEHWTHLNSGFLTEEKARAYLLKTFPGIEIVDTKEFARRHKRQERDIGRRAGMHYEDEEPPEEILPQGDVATIAKQGDVFVLLLLREKKLRMVSGLESEEETGEMLRFLYKDYAPIDLPLFEKVKKARGVL